MIPRFEVDFNEMVDSDLFLLSKDDVRLDVQGRPVQLFEGMQIEVTEDDPYVDGTAGFLIASGIATVNIDGPDWTKAAKWCCRLDPAGIRREASH